MFLGLDDETLALVGFGMDSFVEVISGIGILHLVFRLKKNGVVEQRDKFEKTALRVTGFSFYLLFAALIAGSVINIMNNNQPETTIAGIIISSISIITMLLLVKAKLFVGKSLKSDAIIADANCTKTCFYLSIILLLASLLYEIFQIGYFDILGSLGIAYFAFKEGRESFQKAKTGDLACNCEDSC